MKENVKQIHKIIKNQKLSSRLNAAFINYFGQ
jgi:hypothetical protein